MEPCGVAGTRHRRLAVAPPRSRMSLGLAERKKEKKERRLASIREALGSRSIVLIGLMGAGKTAVGRRLAARLDLPFIDADSEIELAAGPDHQRDLRRAWRALFPPRRGQGHRRLLQGGPEVLATGGGAYMDPGTRAKIKARGLSVWLKADLKVLLHRVGRRDNRPLLAAGTPEVMMRELMESAIPSMPRPT